MLSNNQGIYSLNPYLRYITAKYVEPPVAGAIGGVASIDVTSTSTLLAKGELAGASTVTFSTFADLANDEGQIVGTSTVSLAASASPTAAGELLSTPATITFSTTDADLDGFAYAAVSESITFSHSADLTTQDGAITGNATIQVSPVGILKAKGRLEGTSLVSVSASIVNTKDFGLAIPLRPGYNVFKTKAAYLSPNPAPMLALSANATISISESADLTTANAGTLVGLATISVNANNLQGLQGKGRLEGLAEHTITGTGVIGNASADPISAADSITFSSTADLDGIAQCVGATTFTLSVVNADLTTGAISASGTITIDGTGTVSPFVKASASVPITITTSADGRILGPADALASSVTISISGSADVALHGGTFIGLTATGDARGLSDLQATRQANNLNTQVNRGTNTRRAA